MKPLLPLAAVAAIALIIPVSSLAWNSSRVQYDTNGRLVYPADASGNRIPDFSHAGYKGGGVPLPANIPIKATVSPIAGDDTANIQAAIDQVAAMPLQSDGYRGTVLLTAGVYDVSGRIHIGVSGVVLAGVGDGDDPASNTILRRTGTSIDNVIWIGDGFTDPFKREISDTRRSITTQRVTVGSRTFDVDDPSPYAVGDNIIVWHPSTAAWISAVDNGGVINDAPWVAGEKDIRYHRYITAISGNTITIDAPVFSHLDRSLSQSYVYKYDRAGVTTNVGIEDLQVDIVTAGATSETHCADAIQFRHVENCWVRDCTAKHFVHSGVRFSSGVRCTVERVRAIEPHSEIRGGRRYNFATYHAQLILFKDCFASYARHAFVTNGGGNCSGNVALRATLDHNITNSEGHRWWSNGLLFDSIVTTNRDGANVFAFYNRGDFGTSHGWASVHSVIWNCNASGGNIWCEKPPTAQNYAIGSFGSVSASGIHSNTPGHIEGSNTSGLEPNSLYDEQLKQRLPLATPTFYPFGGATAATAYTVTIRSASDGASIRYTTNGSTPTETSGTLYTGPITVSSTTTLNAVSFRTGWATSEVGTATYTITSTPQVFEAEVLARSESGASSSVVNDSNASGGQVVFFNADGVDDFVAFTIPGVNAGTYEIKMRYKTNPLRGRHVLVANGVKIGATLDQYDPATMWLENVFGHVTFGSTGNQVFQLKITGKNASAGAYTITADRFTITPVAAQGQFAVSGASVMASSHDGNVPANTVDGSLGTRWSSVGDGEWIRFDLGSSKNIAYVMLAFYKGDIRQAVFDVQTSADGATWTTKGSYLSSGITTEREFFDLPPASTGRYVRILGHGNTISMYNSYTEVEIWGN